VLIKPDHNVSRLITAHAAFGAGLSFAHSLRARGFRRTMLFVALGHAVPILGEYSATNLLKLLRHGTHPQIKGVPLAIALGWYNVSYATFAMMESLLNRVKVDEPSQISVLPPLTAVVATSLDLLLDPFGLDLGLWKWTSDGAYATEIEGPNGKLGVPLLNFAGWLGLITSVTLAYQRLSSDQEVMRRLPPGAAGSPEAGRRAAFLLLPYYLPAMAWALKRKRRLKYLLYSCPFSVALWAALRSR